MSQAQNKITPIGIMAILAITILSVSHDDIFKQSYSQTDEETQAIKIAKEFVTSGPTYSFDGIDGTINVGPVKMLKSYPPQYIVDISFDSSHAGYGDRTDKILAQVITPHEISVRVVNNTVMSAVIDGVWDELNQKMLDEQDQDSSNGQIPNKRLSATLVLQINRTVSFEDKYTVTFSKVIQDSRCPADAICIRGGDATIQVELESSESGKREFQLTLDAGYHDSIKEFDGYLMKIVSLEPYPLSSVPTNPSDYVATISISSGYVSPREQIENGVSPMYVTCSDGLVLMQKLSGNSVGCVSPSTAQKLAERGWGTITVNDFKSSKQAVNPASTYCFEKGGKIQTKEVKGEVESICVLPDGSECEQWEYYEGNCPPTNPRLTVMDFQRLVKESADIETIFSIAGEPDTDIGSGIHIYVYNLDDETQIWIGYTDKILYVNHVDSNGNIISKLL